MDFDSDGWLDWGDARYSTLIVCPFKKAGTLDFELDGYKDNNYVFRSGKTKAGRARAGSMETFEISDASLATLDCDMIILGHGDYLDRIANGAGEELSANDLAGYLVEHGLSQTYDQRIWLWTCHGGVPGGLAQGLYMRLYNLGYTALAVSGPRYITHMIPGLLPGVQSVPVGESAETGQPVFGLVSGGPGEAKTPWTNDSPGAFNGLRGAKRQDFLHYGRDWTTI